MKAKISKYINLLWMLLSVFLFFIIFNNVGLKENVKNRDNFINYVTPILEKNKIEYEINNNIEIQLKLSDELKANSKVLEKQINYLHQNGLEGTDFKSFEYNNEKGLHLIYLENIETNENYFYKLRNQRFIDNDPTKILNFKEKDISYNYYFKDENMNYIFKSEDRNSYKSYLVEEFVNENIKPETTTFLKSLMFIVSSLMLFMFLKMFEMFVVTKKRTFKEKDISLNLIYFNIYSDYNDLKFWNLKSKIKEKKLINKVINENDKAVMKRLNDLKEKNISKSKTRYKKKLKIKND